MELHKRRKAITEPEARYFMRQLLLGVQHLHRQRIIHRDLKLGNLFLNDDMELKIGDFGLATRLEYDGERKKTLCGTPNYIAPEVLCKKGHSFEVDVWSIGCILYAIDPQLFSLLSLPKRSWKHHSKFHGVHFEADSFIETTKRELYYNEMITLGCVPQVHAAGGPPAVRDAVAEGHVRQDQTQRVPHSVAHRAHGALAHHPHAPARSCRPVRVLYLVSRPFSF